MASAPSKKPSVVVVGGGPAGALAAKALSERGCAVRLFEAYLHPRDLYGGEWIPDPAEAEPSEVGGRNKAYVIGLSKRGQRCLRRAGVDPQALPGAVDSGIGAMHPSHDPSRKPRLVKRDMGLLLPRAALTCALLDEAEGAGAEVMCSHRLVKIDFDKRVATFAASDDETIEQGYDLLVGADGSKSAVRARISEDLGPDAFTVRTVEDVMQYQVVILPNWRDILSDPDRGGLDCAPRIGTSHLWMDRPSNATVFAFPLHDGRMLVTVIYPQGRLDGMREGGPKAYDDALTALMPDLTLAAREEVARQLAAGRPSSGGTCVWTSSLGPDPERLGTVLVGDSGHGMFPSLGQGCNAALESAVSLAQAVDEVNKMLEGGAASVANLSRWAALVADLYEKIRHEDATAVVDLTFGGYGAQNSRAPGHMPLSFKAQLAVMLLLNKATLGIIPKPAMMRLADDVPYSRLKQLNFMNEKVVLAVFVGLTLPAALYGATKLFRRP